MSVIENMPELKSLENQAVDTGQLLKLNAASQLSAFLIVLKKYTRQETFFIELHEGEKPRQASAVPTFFKVSIKDRATFKSIQRQIIELSGTICTLKCWNPGIGQNTGLTRFRDLRASKGQIEFSIKLRSKEDILTYIIPFETDLNDQRIYPQIQQHYNSVLKQGVNKNDQEVSQFDLLNDEEKEALIYGWNNTHKQYPKGQCLNHLFEEQVQKNPNKTAAYCEGKAISYQALNQRANKLSHILIGEELKPNDLVAVYMDLSFDALASIFAVLKAGGAYLPLHPDNPASRLKYILENARPKQIICQKKYLKDIEFSRKKTLVMEELDLDDTNVYAENPVTRTKPTDLAYVIYTSGSTGMPKGVMIQHDNVVNNMFIIKDRYQLKAEDTVLSMPNLAFDASVSKLFPILTIGGSVVLPTSDEAKNPESLLKLVAEYNCPYFAATPSFIRVINAMNPDLSSLKVVTSGGEALHYKDIDNILNTTDVLNVYGPTEATVSSCSFRVSKLKKDIGKDQRIPIGKPNPNCKIYVLDDNMRPVPIGCVGNLYIGGYGVGRGYLSNPKDTKALFIPNPFEEDDTIYKTGDLARWLPDGNLDFCGRDDDQIKIRGYRITTDEIELTLSGHPAVKHHKIITYADKDQNQSLAAFVVMDPHRKLEKEDIRNFLAGRLPAYMVPSQITLLEEMPLTQTGKIDVQQLKSSLEKTEKSKVDKQGETDLEIEILGYVRELINNSELNRSESLFQAGAHSIHIMQLKLHISNRYKVDIPMKYLFEKPTLKQITNRVKAGRATNDPTLLPSKSEQIVRSKDGNDRFFPLSPSERRVWFLHQYHTQKAVYNIVKSYFIEGELDLSNLQKAFDTIIGRHENLRKTFQLVDGEPLAYVENKKRVHVNFTALGDDQDPEIAADNFIQEEKEKPFDLSKDIPVRVRLIKIHSKKHLLVISLHHIIADGWSFPTLSQELEKLYAANHKNQEPVLDDLGDAYATYPFIEPDKKHQNDSLKYWSDELKGKLEPMNLPYDFQSSENDLYQGSVEKLFISPALFHKIEDLAQQSNATVFTIFLSALKTLLYIYSSDENIKVAIPVAGRNSETSNLIGFFVNTLLINTSFEDDPRFEDIIENIRDRFPDIQEHADLPFDELVTDLRKTQNFDVDALIQIMFTYQNFGESLNLEGLQTERKETDNRFAKFDLTFTVEQDEDDITISAEYRKSKFKRETIRQFLKSYLRLLDECTRHKDLRISEFNLTDSTTKKKILKDWNNTSTVQADCSIHKLFELQAEVSSSARAIIYEDDTILTYKDLNEQANQIAHLLLKHQIREEEPVALFMEESEKSLICMLGVLKAGGAFMPLDMSNPPSRTNQMLRETKTRFVITSNREKHNFSSKGLKVIALDKSYHEISRQSRQNPELTLDPASLAYIMFTSGTSGTPKAVAVEHRSVCRLVMNTNYLELGRIGPFARLMKTGAFGFDASTFEIWGMLLNGGTIYMYAKNKLLSPNSFAKCVAKNDINMLWLTTSWFNELVDADPSLFKPVKYLLVGGEKLSARHINKLKEVNDNTFVYNMYGPTENTTFSLFHKLEGFQDEPIPVGRPIANSTAYILNQSGQLLPPGIPGEICVGGPGLARGYLNDPEKTKQKFIDHPFIDGERLYRTGDLGKWHEDGNITFIGRSDNQVKLNGFRIETQEIENTLIKHSNIEKAVVLLKKQAGHQKLIAFYKSKNGYAVVNEDLRAFLLKELPAYMIPFDFIPVDGFPLTENGKLDKRRLLEGVVFNVQGEDHAAPESLMEEQLAMLWEEVLGINDIGVKSNFFELGGHSLLAVKLMDRIEKEFKKALPVSVLFEAPTIQDLAKILEQSSSGRDSCIVEIQKEGSRFPLFVIPGYLFYYHLANHLGKDQPVYGFEPLNHMSVEEVAARYIREIKKIQPVGPYFIGGYCAGGIVAYEIAQQLKAQGDQLAMLALFEVYTPEATVSKASLRYLSEKWKSLRSKFNSSPSLGEKMNIVRNETVKAIRLLQFKWKSVKGETYALKPYDGQVKIFRAKEGMVGATDHQYAGWDKYCPSENLQVFKVPGNHNTLFKEPNVSHIAKKILQCIDEASEATVLKS